ncbi:16S rRNA processing protein RimM [bacterium]|nr:16S rRNA processing protein RimM [bacterium]
MLVFTDLENHMKSNSGKSEDPNCKFYQKSSDFPEWAFVGKILKPIGLMGWLKVAIYTDFSGRFDAGATLYLGTGKNRYQKMTVSASRPLKIEGFMEILFNSISTKETAQPLSGTDLFIPISERVSPPPNSYYPDELIGMKVEAPDGSIVGEISDFQSENRSPFLTIRSSKFGEVLVCFKKIFIESINRRDRLVKLSHPLSWHVLGESS